MAMNFAECREMIDGCRAAGVPLLVAYYRRSLERYLAIRALIDDGTIGTVRAVTITLHQPLYPADRNPSALPWRVRPEIAGGGRFVDLASHMLDFLDFTLGPIRDVHGIAANQGGHYPAEDIVSAAFQFESGVVGTGSWCFTAFDRVDRTEITGTHGRISYATYDYSPVVVTTAQGARELRFDAPEHIQQSLIQAVVDELNGSGRSPSTGESAAQTSWVMGKMMQTAKSDER
jgi:predicted dehydrogenase